MDNDVISHFTLRNSNRTHQLFTRNLTTFIDQLRLNFLPCPYSLRHLNILYLLLPTPTGFDFLSFFFRVEKFSFYVFEYFQKVVIMPSLDRSGQTNCSYCGRGFSKANLTRDGKSCFGGTKSCPQCPKILCIVPKELFHHIATKHAVSFLDVRTSCSGCEKAFPSCYCLH